jgi:Skp family chaperone for outer membrane proteins
MTSKHIRNTEGVEKHAQMRRQEADQKVDQAIKRLIKTKAKINFNQVAMESGVSKAFLYNNQEIRNRIEGLRKQ